MVLIFSTIKIYIKSFVTTNNILKMKINIFAFWTNCLIEIQDSIDISYRWPSSSNFLHYQATSDCYFEWCWQFPAVVFASNKYAVMVYLQKSFVVSKFNWLPLGVKLARCKFTKLNDNFKYIYFWNDNSSQ